MVEIDRANTTGKPETSNGHTISNGFIVNRWTYAYIRQFTAAIEHKGIRPTAVRQVVGHILISDASSRSR